MAKQHHTRSTATTLNNPMPDRFLTVALYPEPQPKTPWIRLHGLWLQQAGFTQHCRIRVRVMADCLVITKEPAL